MLGQYIGALRTLKPGSPPSPPVNVMSQFYEPLQPTKGLVPNEHVNTVVGALIADTPRERIYTFKRPAESSKSSACRYAAAPNRLVRSHVWGAHRTAPRTSISSLRRKLALVVSFLCVAASSAAALAETAGIISGTVSDDKTRVAVAGVQVIAKSPSATYRTTTDAHGAYRFLSVLPDTYSLSFLKSGYASYSLSVWCSTGRSKP